MLRVFLKPLSERLIVLKALRNVWLRRVSLNDLKGIGGSVWPCWHFDTCEDFGKVIGDILLHLLGGDFLRLQHVVCNNRGNRVCGKL